MSEIAISTSNFKTTRTARIDGALYEVRRLGAGDQLDINRLSSKLMAEGKKVLNLKSKRSVLNDEEDDKAIKLLDDLNKSLAKIDEINADLEVCYTKLFTAIDKEADPERLVRMVGIDGVTKIINQIFNAKEGNDGASA